MKGQMEMIGLVFVVVFVILALLIYVALSSGNPDKLPSQQIHAADTFAKALQTAMLETKVPDCRDSLERTIINCVENSYLTCGSTPICESAFTAWEEMIILTLGEEGSADIINHHASMLLNEQILFQDGEEFLHEPFPEDCSADSLGYAAPKQPLPSRAGTLLFVVKICP